MKATFLGVALAAQFAAVGALAQTSSATNGSAGTGAIPDGFGSDWSTNLGKAMSGDDGTTVRSDSEIATQWTTLSEEDRTVIRRDCTALLQQSGGTNGIIVDNGAATSTTATAAGTTSNTTGDSTTDTTGPAGGTAAGSGTMMTVSAEQMEQICAATKDF